MGVALGMAENEKATATRSAAIAFFVMHQTISSLLVLSGRLESGTLHEGSVANVVGIESLQMGVFGGIIVGLGVAWLNNRFYKIRLPNVVSFFGGTRFVPIISTHRRCCHVLRMALCSGRNIFSGKSCLEIGICGNTHLRLYRANPYSVRSSSRFLSSFLADGCRRICTYRWSDGVRRTKYLLLRACIRINNTVFCGGNSFHER